jgi:hypothetical protein
MVVAQFEIKKEKPFFKFPTHTPNPSVTGRDLRADPLPVTEGFGVERWKKSNSNWATTKNITIRNFERFTCPIK